MKSRVPTNILYIYTKKPSDEIPRVDKQNDKVVYYNSRIL